ncbi:MAG: carboxymuconolactone decarboxylase family protein [Spirochaetales bacterium]|uniref:Carboxymuconolactone decarboxylase family protein n=1 Tax=Candidatus Thalassospirochaeta sargassi TaxID=3119039 RepID=A0AAJ1ML58_9SPIO|nr:carboxymuconolactone decarboxylase family protein [Spirochaetales bacterium]
MKNNQNSRIFGIVETAGIIDKAVYSMMKYQRELKLIDKKFESHIMLAVSEVNGCRICTYVHTQHALTSGTSEEELSHLLDGNIDGADPEEAAALLFAQHYADTSGSYDPAAFERLIETYGKDKASGILATIRLIMFGNSLGINQGFFTDRFKGKRNPDSRLWNEILVMLCPLVLIPAAAIRNLFRRKTQLQVQ